MSSAGSVTHWIGQLRAGERAAALDKLGDVQLQAVALWKMEGYGNDDIAAQLGCVPRTVERKLRAIRTLWIREMPYE